MESAALCLKGKETYWQESSTTPYEPDTYYKGSHIRVNATKVTIKPRYLLGHDTKTMVAAPLESSTYMFPPDSMYIAQTLNINRKP